MNPSKRVEHRLSDFKADCPRALKRRFCVSPGIFPLAVLVGIVAGIAGAQTIVEFPLPPARSQPQGIAAGPAGNGPGEIAAGRMMEPGSV